MSLLPHLKSMKRRAAVAGLCALLVLTACASEEGGTEATSNPSLTANGPAERTMPAKGHERSGGGRGPKAPPPVTIRYHDQKARLEPWTFCYGNGCADGAPPANPLDVGSPDQVEVEYPLDGWTFRASFEPADEKCGRIQSVPLRRNDGGGFIVEPAGYADTYDVTLSGRGDGDLFVTFRWTTPHDGPLPRPSAYLGVITDDDELITSYGIEMSIKNLVKDFRSVKTRITVTAGNGDAIMFRPDRSGGCWPTGSLYWDGPNPKGHEAARLGDPPFTYEVDLVLDGGHYTGRGVWPDDEIRGSEPYVRLTFTPELPALRPR